MSDNARKPVVFFYVQHLLGIGHQMRAAAITRAMLARGINVHYVSGGFDEARQDLGSASFHQLPPVRSDDHNYGTYLDAYDKPIDDAWWSKRKSELFRIYNEIKPDLVLMEGFPFARRKFRTELIPFFEAIKGQTPIATSIRDILEPPTKEKRAVEAVETAKEFIDHILIHGNPGFFPVERNLPLMAQLSDRFHYTGYVAPQDGPYPSEGDGRDWVILSTGGGAIGENLVRNAIKARALSSLSGKRWHILIGPNFPDHARAMLEDLPIGMTWEPSRPDFRALLSRAFLSISQGGYNTTMDILVTGVRSVIVPFNQGTETEQLVRTQLLAEFGRVVMVPDTALTPENLAQAVDNSVKNEKGNALPLQLNGANETARLIENLIKK